MLYGYTRVSTTEQAADGRTSIEDQQRRIRGVAMMRGETEVQIIEDIGVSGALPLSRRPSGATMLALLRSGDMVIASKLDRLFRSASDALVTVEELQRRGVHVVLADIGPDPVTANGSAKMFFGILASFAEFERSRIAERMADGKRGKVARAGYIGGEPPYGYRVMGTRATAVLVEDEAEIGVLRIVASMPAPTPLRRVAAELNKRGLTSRRGRPFGPEQVKCMRRQLMKQAAE